MHNVIDLINIAVENYNALLSTKVVYAIPGFLIFENVCTYTEVV